MHAGKSSQCDSLKTSNAGTSPQPNEEHGEHRDGDEHERQGDEPEKHDAGHERAALIGYGLLEPRLHLPCPFLTLGSPHADSMPRSSRRYSTITTGPEDYDASGSAGGPQPFPAKARTSRAARHE